VPAPITVRTVCGVFVLRRDGSVVYGQVPRWAPMWAPDAVSHPGPRTWVAHRHKRLLVYRDRRLLWHSQVTGGTDDVAVGHGHVAFTVWRRYGMSLWLAPLGGLERKVAPGEEIVGWIPGGLMTQRGAELRLRNAEGHLLRSLGRVGSAIVDRGRAVILRTDGLLVRTDGWHTRQLADLRPYGVANHPWLQRLPGGVWEIQAGSKVLFLDRHGHPFAFLPDTTLDGGVAVLPDRSAVLFVQRHRASDADPGVLTVYRLDRGARVPRRLFTSRVRQLSCGEWGGLAYRRGRVLFTSSYAGSAVLDPTGRARPINLTRMIRRLLPDRRNAPAPSYVGWS
jgi:hypothetical protein